VLAFCVALALVGGVFGVLPPTWSAHAATATAATPIFSGAATPAAVVDHSSQMTAFTLGSDHQVWYSRQTSEGAASWTDWQTVGHGILTSAPAAVVDAAGRILVFAVGSDGQIWYSRETSPGADTWQNWTSIGAGYLTTPPTVILDARQLVEVFAVGTDHQVYRSAQLTRGGDGWTGWQSLGGYLITAPAVVNGWTATSYGVFWGNMEVYAVGSDHQIYRDEASPGVTPTTDTWGGWQPVPGGIQTDQRPVVATDVSGVELFTVGNDHRVYANLETTIWSGHTWHGWNSLGDGYLTAPPTPALNWSTNSYHVLEVFSVGSDQRVYHDRQVSAGSTSWTGWQPVGAQPVTAAPAVTLINEKLQLLSFSGNGRFYYTRQAAPAGTSWAGWSVATSGYTWAPGKVFSPGESYVDSQGDTLIFQDDGNFVEYDATGQPVWATDTAGRAPGGRVEFQAFDGNLVVYNSANQPVWATDVAAPGGSLEFTRGGSLAVYGASQQPGQKPEPEYVQLEKDRDLVLKQIQDFLNKLEQDHNAHLIDDQHYQALKDAGQNLVQKFEAYDPKKPCATWKDVFKSTLVALGVGGTAASAEAADKLKGIQWLGAFAFALLIDIDAHDMFVRCWDWNEVRDILRQWRRDNPNQSSGLIPRVSENIQDGGMHVTWYDFTQAGDDGKVEVVVSDGTVVGHPEWQVDFGADPQEPANTIIDTPIETDQNGVHGTLFTMQDGEHIFVPNGPVDYTAFAQQGDDSITTIYDQQGEPLLAIDGDRNLVDINDSPGSPFDTDRGGTPWGWGLAGYGGWSTGGGDYDPFDDWGCDVGGNAVVQPNVC
jgi:hypothetical protein